MLMSRTSPTHGRYFVSDKSRPEVITLGLNTVREICFRVPLAMEATLLADLIEYRNEKVTRMDLTRLN